MNATNTMMGDLRFVDPEANVEATVQYTGTAEPQRYSDAYRWYRTPIHDGRQAGCSWTLAEAGFQLVRHKVDRGMFESDDLIRAQYYPQVEQLLLQHTGASKAFVFDHTVRRGVADSARKPAHHVHNDYTALTGTTRVHEEIGAELLAPHQGKRMIQVNVWRSIAGTVGRSPLALADARSVAPGDLVPANIYFPDSDHVGQIYAVKHNPNQRWVYFPRVTADEAILIKGFDSKKDALARFTPHTAFELSQVPASVPVRQSIEARAFLFY